MMGVASPAHPVDRGPGLFAACLAIALLLHLGTVFLLRNATFFGMAAIREDTRRLFRVPVGALAAPRLRPHPQRLPDRADVVAAIERSVAAAVSESLAELPAAAMQEPPPASRLEEFAQTREAEAALPRFAAPTHLDVVEQAAEALGLGALREKVQVVARRIEGDGSGSAISAATVASTQREGPVGAAAYAGRVTRPLGPTRPPAPSAAPRLARPEPAPPPLQAKLPPDPTRRGDPAPLQRGEPWDAFFDVTLTVYRPVESAGGYFRVSVAPKAEATLPVAARDVLFVLDASKSMGTDRFAQAQAVFATGIENLHPDDRFTVVAFQSEATWWRPSLQRPTAANRRDAARWIRALQSAGRTDVYRGLAPALDAVDGGTRPIIVLFCSDGRPTAGERNSRTLINELTADNAGRTSIFAYGAGSQVNRYLLDLLSYRNRGAAAFGTRPQDMGPGLAAMERSVREPVLLRPQLRLTGALPGTLYPHALSDIYASRGLTVWGRLAPGAKVVGVQLLATSQGKAHEILGELPLSAAGQGGPNLAQEWAAQKIFYLVGELTAGGRQPALAAEVARLGREYGLPASYIEASHQ